MPKTRNRPLSSVEIFGLVDEFVQMLAKEISVPAERIYAFVRKAIGKKTAKREERRVLEEQIIELRSQGRSDAEIADLLKVSKPRVCYIAHCLICENRIERRFPGRPLGRTKIDLASERVQTILTMMKSGARYREIGKALGVSHGRVEQIIRRIRRDHGDAILDAGLVSCVQAAQELGILPLTLQRRCRAWGITMYRRGWHGTFISTSDLAVLRETMSKQCVICNKAFTPLKRGKTANICSMRCSNERSRIRYQEVRDGKRDLSRVNQWYAELIAKLRGRAVPPDEQWLVLSKAVQRGGLTRMQVIWLGYRQILSRKPDPVRMWRGKPITLYAASELDIAKEVYKAWKLRKVIE